MLRKTLIAASLLGVVGLVACGDDDADDAPTAGRAGSGAQAGRAGSGGSAGGGGRAGGAGAGEGGAAGAGGERGPELGPCLDRPDELPRPPVGQLPCDLFPPGFAL